MLTKFGGVPGFARAWKQEFEAVKQRLPGSRLVTAHLRALLRLWEVVEEPQPPVDFHQLPDPELADAKERAVRECVTALIREKPELVVLAAEAMGWTVSPPGE